MAEKPNKQPPPAEGWVIQHYVHPPLLLAGRKFDVRVYCLIARTEPALWFFHPEYSETAVLTRSLLLRLHITTSTLVLTANSILYDAVRAHVEFRICPAAP